MLENLARHHTEQTFQLADSLAALLEPLLLIVTGVIIGTLVVAMYLPIFPSGGCDECGIALAHEHTLNNDGDMRQRKPLQAIEYAVFLLLNADKCRAFSQLFQAGCTNVGTGRTQTAENVECRIIHRATQSNFTVLPSAARYFATPPT